MAGVILTPINLVITSFRTERRNVKQLVAK